MLKIDIKDSEDKTIVVDGNVIMVTGPDSEVDIFMVKANSLFTVDNLVLVTTPSITLQDGRETYRPVAESDELSEIAVMKCLTMLDEQLIPAAGYVITETFTTEHFIDMLDRSSRSIDVETIEKDTLSIDGHMFATIDADADKRFFAITGDGKHIVELEYEDAKYDRDSEIDMETYDALPEEEQDENDLIGKVLVIVNDIESFDYIAVNLILTNGSLYGVDPDMDIYEYSYNDLLLNKPLTTLRQ